MKRLIKVIILVLLVNLLYFVLIGQHRAARHLVVSKSLNLYETVSSYQMHTAIWLFGIFIAPEAAYEARLLHTPHKEPIVKYSSFPSNAKPETWKGITCPPSQLPYMLALNSPDLQYEKSEYSTVAHLTVKYSDCLYNIKGIQINTALFRYLQDCGLLHPYEIYWIDVRVE